MSACAETRYYTSWPRNLIFGGVIRRKCDDSFFLYYFFFFNIFYPLYGQSQQKSVWGKWSADCLTWYFFKYFFPFLVFFQHSSEVSILFRDSSRIMPTLAPPLAPPTMHWLHEVSHGHAHCPESMHHQSRHAIAGWTHGRMVTCLAIYDLFKRLEKHVPFVSYLPMFLAKWYVTFRTILG